MVYEGKPSRGCAVCRKRKIRCNEALPGCSYCLKKQIICPGYKSQFDLAWKNQNFVAEQSVRRRTNAGEKERKHGRERLRLDNPPLSGKLSQDFEDYAVSFFFSSYARPPRDLGDQRGFLDCLYPIWANISSTSPLVPAVNAVSSIMLEAWSQITPAQPLSLSRNNFTKAIEALRQKLLQSNNVSDDVLLAAIMLYVYENMRSLFFPSRNFENPHIDGITALAHARCTFPISSDVSQSILREASHLVINKAIRNQEAVPPGISSWDFGIPKSTGELLHKLGLEVANLQAEALQLSKSPLEADTFALIDRLLKTEGKLLEWASSVPEDWIPLRVSGLECIPLSVREAGLYQQHCIVYKSINVANTFLSYCSSRIYMHLAVIRCSQHLTHSDTTLSLHAIQDAADMICDSVPFLLGDRTHFSPVDDKTALYPHGKGEPVSSDHLLAAASYGGYMASRLAELMRPEILLRSGQQQWIGGQLRRIGMVYGIRSG